jgi:hypothetical protein
MTQYTRTVIIVIIASLKAQAETLARRIDPSSSGEVFSVKLSANGQEPPTHYLCSWRMTEAQYARAQQELGGLTNQVWMYDVPPATLDTVLADRGLQRITGTITQLP